MNYGVQHTGYVRKPLSVILAELEASMVTEFGPGVIQTPQSPLGQINGLMADMIAHMWELAEDIYQSYDPDQAEGNRLDVLARIRLLNRAVNESDASLRMAVTNQGRAHIDIQDLVRAVRGVPGVTYAEVFVADDGNLDEFTVERGTVVVSVLGGDDGEIAEMARQFLVPGVITFGNTPVNIEVDGFCRTLTLLRPTLVPVTLEVNVRTFNDRLGCPPPSTVAMREAITQGMNLVNGDDITLFRLRVLERAFETVEVLSFRGRRDGVWGPVNSPVRIGFTELATLSFDRIDINLNPTQAGNNN